MLRKSLRPSILMRDKLQEADAYLTVYLSLSITVILSLILALLQGARVGAVKMKSELVTDIACTSVLGEYNRALFDKYGLIFLDDSFSTSKGSIKNVEEHLSLYFTKNFELSPVGILTGRKPQISARLNEVSVEGFSVASDGNGAVLRRQILAYMEADPVEGSLAEIEKNIGILKESGYDSLNVEELAGKNAKELSDIKYTDIDEDGEEVEITADNPAGQVSAKKTIGILSLCAPDINALSDAAINTDRYISNRERNHGTGLDQSEPESLASTALFNEYIFEKCGCYGRENAEAVLKYELEYIYGGKASDYKNLEKVINTLFFWREASNFAYILTDEQKQMEAEALAMTAAIVLQVPTAVEAIKYAIIFSWTFAETISDLRILLTGGRVPLIKDCASWNLSLENMLNFQNHLKEGGGSGLSYEDYLKMLLLMKDKTKKTFRLMDIMEMNVRTTEGNSHFKMDNCIDVFRASFDIQSRNIRSLEIERIYGYERY